MTFRGPSKLFYDSVILCATSLCWCCHSCGSCIATSYAALLHFLFLQGQQKDVLVYISMVTQSVIPNLCCGQFSCSCFEILGGKDSGLSAPMLCWAHSPLSWKLLPAVLETLAFLVAEKSLKTWNLTVFWRVTHEFYHEGYILLPPFNFPLSLCMQPHLQMFREECLHSCTLKAASVYAKVSTRLHRCHYSQRAGARVLLDRAACV